MDGPLRMAVIGVGYFGALHARKLRALPGAELVAVADRDPERAAAVAAELGVRWVQDHRMLLRFVDAVIVAVPTVAHCSIAGDFLRRGIHVLVEKPIAHDVASGKRLVRLARGHSCVLQVGHLVRFSGMIRTLRRGLGRPLYIDAVRIAPFKVRGTDVDVVLDLMVHDLDLVLALVDEPLIRVDAAGAPVMSRTEDIASARLAFANGCIANLTASRVSLKTERKMRIFAHDTYFAVDFDQRLVRIVSRGQGEFAPGIPRIDVQEERYQDTDELALEDASFITAVRQGRPPEVSGEEGLRALDAATRVLGSLREHAELVRRSGLATFPVRTGLG